MKVCWLLENKVKIFFNVMETFDCFDADEDIFPPVQRKDFYGNILRRKLLWLLLIEALTKVQANI